MPKDFVNVTCGAKEVNGVIFQLEKGWKSSEMHRHDNVRRDDPTKSQ